MDGETGHRVLVVDDEDVIRDLLEDVFDMAGVQAMAVSDGAKALALLRDEAFNVVFCDLRMPGIVGAELVRKMLALAPTTRIIMMSGDDSSDGDLRAALDAGASSVLNKPFRFKDVLAAYEDCVAIA